MQNSFKTTFNSIPKRLDCGRLMQLLTAFHHLRRHWQIQKILSESPNGIQYP